MSTAPTEATSALPALAAEPLKLSPEQQDISTQSKAVATMLEFPSAIKRPVIETAAGQLLVGYDPALFASFLK